jgi:hypothetical protein
LLAVQFAAVKGGDGSPGFMPFHVNGGEAFAVAGEKVFGKG